MIGLFCWLEGGKVMDEIFEIFKREKRGGLFGVVLFGVVLCG